MGRITAVLLLLVHPRMIALIADNNGSTPRDCALKNGHARVVVALDDMVSDFPLQIIVCVVEYVRVSRNAGRIV
jgi:hypothetical protein